ncbi:MAG: NAD-dependent epimerase/dehydratase family protein [Acidimicrobiales bacterium]
MKTVIVTGAGGLIGAQSVRYFATLSERVIGVDNDMRAYFFGEEASTSWAVAELRSSLSNYDHQSIDIRDRSAVDALLADHGSDVDLIIHTAAQPSHDWAANEPFTDFDVNAGGTLNLLEATRRHAPDASFIFTSTNKVYGDTPNRLPLVETDQRWTLDESHEWAEFGIPETMSIDHSTHSLFGASKVAADILCQEYGRYFGLKTGVFRGGCLTGPGHSGAQLHGFLAYLMKCTATGTPYTVFGYKGKQVRDNIHADDLVRAFHAFHQNPRAGEAYNIGGGPEVNCSMREAVDLCQEIAGRELEHSYTDENRIGDHIWWVSDIRKFKEHNPDWELRYDIRGILEDIYRHGIERWDQDR